MLLLHGYHREQVAPGTGDLPQVENKPVESLLRAEFRALKIVYTRTHLMQFWKQELGIAGRQLLSTVSPASLLEVAS